MKNYWLVLAMVFVFGLIGSPVFAFAPDVGDGVYIGKSTEAAMTSATTSTEAVQLETVMETLLATQLMTTIYRPFMVIKSGSASNVPERYDKDQSSELTLKVRKLFDKLTKSPVLKSHSA